MDEVVADGVHVLPLRPPPFLIRAPAGAHENGSGADGVTEIDVEPFVAHDPRLCRIDVQILHRIFDHARQGFPAAALHRQFLDRAARMVRAEVQRIEIRIGGLQAAPHLRMTRRHELRRNQAMRDAGLIGHHHEQITGALQEAQRIAGPRVQLEILETVEIADVDVQRPITIQKYRSSLHLVPQTPNPKPQAPSPKSQAPSPNPQAPTPKPSQQLKDRASTDAAHAAVIDWAFAQHARTAEYFVGDDRGFRRRC